MPCRPHAARGLLTPARFVAMSVVERPALTTSARRRLSAPPLRTAVCCRTYTKKVIPYGKPGPRTNSLGLHTFSDHPARTFVSDRLTEPCEIVPNCPICDVGAMTLAARHKDILICVCTECGTSLSVPETAMRTFVDRRQGSQT